MSSTIYTETGYTDPSGDVRTVHVRVPDVNIDTQGQIIDVDRVVVWLHGAEAPSGGQSAALNFAGQVQVRDNVVDVFPEAKEWLDGKERWITIDDDSDPNWDTNYDVEDDFELMRNLYGEVKTVIGASFAEDSDWGMGGFSSGVKMVWRVLAMYARTGGDSTTGFTSFNMQPKYYGMCSVGRGNHLGALTSWTSSNPEPESVALWAGTNDSPFYNGTPTSAQNILNSVEELRQLLGCSTGYSETTLTRHCTTPNRNLKLRNYNTNPHGFRPARLIGGNHWWCQCDPPCSGGDHVDDYFISTWAALGSF